MPGKQIDVRATRSKTQQITDQLREMITDGELAPGQRLPTERKLAERF